MTPDAPTAPAAPDGPPKGKPFLVLLLIAAVVGLVVSLAAWLFLEAVHQTQVGVFDKLPEQLGYDSAPLWWPLPVCGIAGVITAAAIMRLPGFGGHIPAQGLAMSPARPIDLPGVILAAARDGRPRPRARPRGAAARPGQRPRRLRRAPGEEGRAAAARRGARGGRELRGGLVPVRVADDRGGAADRGHRAGRPAADVRADPGPAGVGRRLAGLDRPGLVHRPQHERLRDRPAGPAGLPAPDPGRLRVDGPGRGRDHAPDPGGGPPRPPRPAARDARAVRAHPDRGSRRRRPGDRLHAGHRQGLRPGPVLRPGRDRPAGGEPGRVVGGRARRGAAVQGPGVGRIARGASGAARRSRRCSSASRPACWPPTCPAST